MNRQNIIRITLFLSVLVFNPAVAETLRSVTNIRANTSRSITEEIASSLHDMGLEQKAAKQRAEELVGGDAELFALMLDNLLHNCSDLSREDIVGHFSKAALHRKNIELNSYDHLIDIYSRINHSTPGKETLEELSAIAKGNTMLIG